MLHAVEYFEKISIGYFNWVCTEDGITKFIPNVVRVIAYFDGKMFDHVFKKEVSVGEVVDILIAARKRGR